ncbi:hypothetical protein L479_01852 [Exiguobacterium sp. S17]|nr:hypothetical protein L479_01852 [Exiguobacterium sp. S17]
MSEVKWEIRNFTFLTRKMESTYLFSKSLNLFIFAKNE